MKNFRAAALALLLICAFVFGCKFGTNSNVSNNSNNRNGIDLSNKNDGGGNKNENKDDGGDIGKPDVSKIPIPTKKTDEPPPPSGGSGEVISHTGAQVQFTIPSGWSGKAANDRYIVAAPDDRLEVFFYVPEDGNFDKAVDDIVAEMKKYLGNMKVTEQAKKTTLNGMNAVSEAGTGTYDGTSVVWVLMAVKSPKDPLFIVTVCDPKDFEGNKAGYQALIGSVKPK